MWETHRALLVGNRKHATTFFIGELVRNPSRKIFVTKVVNDVLFREQKKVLVPQSRMDNIS